MRRPKFLVTTGDSGGYEPAADVIKYAAGWCCGDASRLALAADTDLILDYHWGDQGIIERDIQHLKSCYEHMLLLLSQELNEIHGLNLPVKGWRIILGPWLFDFIRIVYDYKMIAVSAEKNGFTHTKIGIFESSDIIPQDFEDFHRLISMDGYNNWLLGSIIASETKINIEYCYLPESEKKIKNRFPKKTFSITQIFKRFFTAIYSSFLIPDQVRKFIFVSSYFNSFDLIKLQLKLRQFPMPFLFDPKPNLLNCDLDRETRSRFGNGRGNVSALENLVVSLLPQQIPLVYLEGLKECQNFSKNFFPSTCEVIFTANAYYYNEVFKYWAAKCTLNGSKLLIEQHGAYGESLWSVEEDHMICIADLFYSWGWRHQSDKVRPMPATKLIWTNRLLKGCRGDGILVVVNSDIINNMHSQKPMIVDVAINRYLLEIASLKDMIAPELKDKLKLRLYHTAYSRNNWDFKSRLAELGMSRYITPANENYYQSVKQSKLVVITYHPNVTGLESLAANVPTVFVWDQDILKIRPDATQAFEELKAVGMFHESIDSLTQFLNCNHDRLDAWWYSSEVQSAVSSYCSKYALTSSDALDNWAFELERFLEK